MNKAGFRAITRNYAHLASKRPLTILLISFALLAVAIWMSMRIRLDPDLEALLPQDTRTVLAMKETKKRYGSTDLFTIAIQAKSPEMVARVQDSVVARLGGWKDVVFVQANRDNSFFLKHALLYLPEEHLDNIVDQLSDIRRELGSRGPLSVDLLGDLEESEGSEAKGDGKREWFDASLPQELGLPDEAAEAFAEFLKPEEDAPAEGSEFDPKEGIPDSLKSRLMAKYRDREGYVGVVQATLERPSSDINYVGTVLSRSEDMLAHLRKAFNGEINISVEGPYKELEEVNSLKWNGILATGISVGLIIGLIFFFFRGLGPLIAILYQVAFACMLTLGATGITYGRLNLYTVFVIAILLGMGIDYSIHIMGHTQKLAQRGMNWTEAVADSLSVLFYPMLLAALTTIAGLLTLLSADFVGFYEFGVIASMGIVFSWLSAFLLLPALIFLLARLEKKPMLKWLSLPRHQEERFRRADNWPWRKILGRAVAVMAVVGVILLFFIPQTEFEHDFSKLRDKSPKPKDNSISFGTAISSNRKSSQPIVALSESPATMEAFHDTLLHRLTQEKDPYIRSFLTLTTFVPPEEAQENRMDLIEEIGDLVSARVFDKAKGRDKEMIERLRDMTEVKPFGAEDIPDWALNLLRERDGSYGRIAFIYGNYNSSDAQEAARFQERYGQFKINGEELTLFSSSFIYSDIIRLVKQDSAKMSILISLILILTLSLSLRNWRLILACVAGLGAAGIFTVGAMGLLGIRVDVFNLIVIPTLLGVGIDSVIHLTLGYNRMGPKHLGELFRTTGFLVTASAVTSAAGYAGMLFTSHMGIISIGKLAVLGLLCALACALIVAPWICLKLVKVPAEVPLES